MTDKMRHALVGIVALSVGAAASLLTPGAETRFTATNLTPGYHVFSVLAEDAQGTLRTSDPAMVVVRKS